MCVCVAFDCMLCACVIKMCMRYFYSVSVLSTVQANYKLLAKTCRYSHSHIYVQSGSSDGDLHTVSSQNVDIAKSFVVLCVLLTKSHSQSVQRSV